MSLRPLVIVLLVSSFALAATPGCQKIKTTLGLGETVSDPAPGSPEALIQSVLKTARMNDEAEGWEAFVDLLHSQETASPAAMNQWQTMRFPTIRRKVDLLLVDRSALIYKLMDKREEGKDLKVFVQNSQSDMPSPCTLRLDPERGNSWRVFGSCF
jgi:hypothetical protein